MDARHLEFCRGTSGLDRQTELAYLARQPHSPAPAAPVREFLSAQAVELRWRSGGGAAPTEQEISQRLEICRACKECDLSAMRCTACGCYLTSRLLPPVPIGKAECATQKCPRGYWDYTGGYEPEKSACGACKGRSGPPAHAP